MKNYFNFTGRARRKEYWMFFLANIIIGFFLGIIIAITKTPNIVGLYQLAVLIPSISVGVRRMHDINMSGWFLLIPIVNFFLLMKEGDAAENRFGPDPKASERVQGARIRKTA